MIWYNSCPRVSTITLRYIYITVHWKTKKVSDRTATFPQKNCQLGAASTKPFQEMCVREPQHVYTDAEGHE